MQKYITLLFSFLFSYSLGMRSFHIQTRDFDPQGFDSSIQKYCEQLQPKNHYIMDVKNPVNKLIKNIENQLEEQSKNLQNNKEKYVKKFRKAINKEKYKKAAKYKKIFLKQIKKNIEFPKEMNKYKNAVQNILDNQKTSIETYGEMITFYQKIMSCLNTDLAHSFCNEIRHQNHKGLKGISLDILSYYLAKNCQSFDQKNKSYFFNKIMMHMLSNYYGHGQIKDKKIHFLSEVGTVSVEPWKLRVAAYYAARDSGDLSLMSRISSGGEFSSYTNSSFKQLLNESFCCDGILFCHF